MYMSGLGATEWPHSVIRTESGVTFQIRYVVLDRYD